MDIKEKKKEIHVKAQLRVYRDPVAVAMPCASALISGDPTSLVLKQQHQPLSWAQTN